MTKDNVIRKVTPEIEEYVKAFFREVPYPKLLGMELTKLGEGLAIIRLEIGDHHRQPHGLLHGGATASVIDTATAFAILSHLGEHEKAATVDLTVHYLRAVTEGEIVCTAKLVKAGRTLLTVSADVVDGQDRLVATALSTYSRIQVGNG
jgi:acyl-CoA thioesterase